MNTEEVIEMIEFAIEGYDAALDGNIRTGAGVDGRDFAVKAAGLTKNPELSERIMRAVQLPHQEREAEFHAIIGELVFARC